MVLMRLSILEEGFLNFNIQDVMLLHRWNPDNSLLRSVRIQERSQCTSNLDPPLYIPFDANEPVGPSEGDSDEKASLATGLEDSEVISSPRPHETPAAEASSAPETSQPRTPIDP
ncbi:hypothetical protein N7488_008174 [Penicillium malachiteum]|nr:hypothetical protein N7488_008174 [Penicillium malachiteum]